MNISWKRTNFHGREVSLLGGVVLAGQLVTGHAINAVRGDQASARIAVAALGAGLAGAYDDLADESACNKTTKGLHGHLKALREGRISPGLVKMLALIATGLVAAKPRREILDWLVEAGIIAGAANLVNLVDLRPGRALKIASLGALAGLIPPRKASQESDIPAEIRRRRTRMNLVCSTSALPLDLGELTMLGDTGSNALGAALGATWVQGRSRGAKLAVLAGITALTLASEKISFSAVIENNPLMKTLDDLGRLKENP